MPFATLTPELAREAAAHVLRFMEALDPLVDDAWDRVLAVAAPALRRADHVGEETTPRRRRPRRPRAAG
ncbi:MAG TPA: hypothetical protein VNN12_09230 [Dehalococcoidia bacterium]|nr:hypothetical protein [Dehalococcoidia bacterium]